jgi:hypothetical protein
VGKKLCVEGAENHLKGTGHSMQNTSNDVTKHCGGMWEGSGVYLSDNF